MCEGNNLNTIVAEWVRKAEGDFACATRLLTVDEEWPAENACFHAQQSIEKYIKALLVLYLVDFPKTHDVRRLVSMLPLDVQIELSPAEEDALTPYATVTRYPGGYEPLTIKDARAAVRIARRVRRQIRAMLPKQAIRRRKP